MSETAKIVTDAEVERVHANANFGATITKREVVDRGVLSYALGFTTGSTMMTILIEHGLLRQPRSGSDESVLTKKGFRYLRAFLKERHPDLRDVFLYLRGKA